MKTLEIEFKENQTEYTIDNYNVSIAEDGKVDINSNGCYYLGCCLAGYDEISKYAQDEYPHLVDDELDIIENDIDKTYSDILRTYADIELRVYNRDDNDPVEYFYYKDINYLEDVED